MHVKRFDFQQTLCGDQKKIKDIQYILSNSQLFFCNTLKMSKFRLVFDGLRQVDDREILNDVEIAQY